MMSLRCAGVPPVPLTNGVACHDATFDPMHSTAYDRVELCQ